MFLVRIKLVLSLIANLAILVSVTSQVIRQGCPEKCANFTVPYPFGLEEDCSWDKHFHLICNYSYNPPKLFLHPGSENDILEISLDGYLRKLTYVARDCYDKTGDLCFSTQPHSQLGKFLFSPTRNKFTAVGCDTMAKLIGSSSSSNEYVSGCISICHNESNIINGSCSGIGCCQTSIPKELSKFNVTLSSFWGHKNVWSFNPCSYAFISEVGYVFSPSDLHKFPHKIPMVLDWAIGDQGCDKAAKNVISYGCKDQNSVCQDSDNGPGYRCFCKAGYSGNPYVHNYIAQDIDECKNKNLNDCTHKCHNTEGSYTCSCPKWFQGDGRRNGQRCTFNLHKITHFIIGDAVFLIFLVLGSLVLHFYRRKRMQKKLKEHFFEQNGGLILLDRMSQRALDSINTFKIFKSEELEAATNNFSDSRICGRGGFGIIYKGSIADGTIVAIKKSKTVDQSQIEQFINEITLLSQINHRNVVRFLGCCLETPVPLLVYEFITNGTLSDHIHKNNNNDKPRLPWQTRLKIAAETAGVLAYLHSAHSNPIIHRDIKPTNILLDDDFTSKVSDFGASRLIPNNLNEMCTMVQGTLGYLDPEYLQTSQLTEKSDVYSFGVVLVEILTGLKAVSFERAEEERSLVKYFLSLTKDSEMMEIFNKEMIHGDNVKEIMKVVKIAKMCLRVKGDERPSMKEVALELEGLVMRLKHKWEVSNREESEHLLGARSSDHGESSTRVNDQYSGNTHDFFSLIVDDGRFDEV